MANGKQVRLSTNTMKQLKEIGEPFESVDDCLQRLVNCSCVKTEMKKLAEKSVQEESEEEET